MLIKFSSRGVVPRKRRQGVKIMEGTSPNNNHSSSSSSNQIQNGQRNIASMVVTPAHHHQEQHEVFVSTKNHNQSLPPNLDCCSVQALDSMTRTTTATCSSFDKTNHDKSAWTCSRTHDDDGVVGIIQPFCLPNSCNEQSRNINGRSNDDPSSAVPKATPSPPKTAFMCFSISRTKGTDSTKALDFDALADEYKRLPLVEKKKWEAEAQKDKQRYSDEKNGHQGPWQLPVRRAKKHPLAPKRPMSAFLRYSKCLRNKVKAENPHVDNTDISRLLGHMWRNARNEEKEPFVQQELKERSIYKVEMAKWRMMQKKMEIEMALNNGRFVSSYQQYDSLESPDISDDRYNPEDFRRTSIDFHTPQQHNKPFLLPGTIEEPNTSSSYDHNYSGHHPTPYYDRNYHGGYHEEYSSTTNSCNYYNDTKRYHDQFNRYDDGAPPRFENGSFAVDSSSEGCHDHHGVQEDFHRHPYYSRYFEHGRIASDIHRHDDYGAELTPYHYPIQNDSVKKYHGDHDERFYHPKRHGYSRYWDRNAGGIREFQEPSPHSF